MSVPLSCGINGTGLPKRDYVDEELGFAISCPAGWDVFSQYPAVFACRDHVPSDEGYSAVLVATDQTTDLGLEDYVQGNINGMAGLLADFELIGRTGVTLTNGEQAEILDFQGSIGSMFVGQWNYNRHRMLIAIHDGVAILVTCAAGPVTFPNVERSFEEALSSLVLF